MRRFLCFFLACTAWSLAAAQPADASRGQLLYSTHCVECHTTRMHWREQRLAHDWDSLKAQVRRWQGEARLQSSEQDIADVAPPERHHLPPAAAGAGRPGRDALNQGALMKTNVG